MIGFDATKCTSGISTKKCSPYFLESPCFTQQQHEQMTSKSVESPCQDRKLKNDDFSDRCITLNQKHKEKTRCITNHHEIPKKMKNDANKAHKSLRHGAKMSNFAYANWIH